MTKWRVKEICKEKGITLAVLAKRMDVTAPSVTQYLQSESMSSATLIKIADALGVKIDDLIERNHSNISGFVDVNGRIYRINSKEDLGAVLSEIDEHDNHPEVSK